MSRPTKLRRVSASHSALDISSRSKGKRGGGGGGGGEKNALEWFLQKGFFSFLVTSEKVQQNEPFSLRSPFAR